MQTQIETALRAATGEVLFWPAVVRAGDGALPVVLLDGFDELIQVTGQSHQQYLSSSKNPNGYCGIGGTGVSRPIGVAPAE